MKIKIDIKGRQYDLTPGEARRLHSQLDKLFAKEKVTVIPAPLPPAWPPIYLTLMVVPSPAPLSPPQWEPPNKWDPYCIDQNPRITCEATCN